MKSALATVVVLTAAVALASGGFAMGTMGPGSHANCLAAIPGSAPCVGGADPIQFAVAHVSAFLSASLGVAGPLTLAFLLLSMLFAWPPAADALAASATGAAFSRIFSGTAERMGKQRHWISLHEKRDPSLAYAASR